MAAAIAAAKTWTQSEGRPGDAMTLDRLAATRWPAGPKGLKGLQTGPMRRPAQNGNEREHTAKQWPHAFFVGECEGPVPTGRDGTGVRAARLLQRDQLIWSPPGPRAAPPRAVRVIDPPTGGGLCRRSTTLPDWVRPSNLSANS